MGDCKYCGKSAGFFRTKHAECEQQELHRVSLINDGRRRIAAEATRAIRDGFDLDGLRKRIVEIENTKSVPAYERRALLAKGWENSVDGFLEDGILDRDEEKRLAEFSEHFGLSQSELDVNGALSKTVKAGILRDILDGVVPERMSINGNLPINFQRNERVVWVFANSEYLEDKTRREYVGRSQGASIRVMKGVYYRVGAFKGHSVERTERVHIDTGWVAVTDKNIYFAGTRKSVRLSYAKIVSFEPFSDGIGVIRDAATAKPQIFVTGDGWFTYNLVTNLSQM